MSQPSISVNDYSPVSIVVRSQPDDFLKPYAGILTSHSGKWNPNLKAPTGSGRLGGWIFPKKNEAAVREALSNILGGAQAPIPSARQLQYSARQESRQGTAVRPTSPTTQQVRPVTVPTRKPLTGAILPGGAPAGFQQMMITVIKPEVGQTLNLTAEGQTVAVQVIEKIDDRQFKIQMGEGDDAQYSFIALETAWKVPGYCAEHVIERQ